MAESCPAQAGADVIEIDDGFIVEPPAIRTSAATYALEPHDFGIGLETNIPCTDGEWTSVWSPAIFACISPAIVIRPGRSVARQLHVFGGHPDCDCGPRFEVEDPRGMYRIVLLAVLSSFDGDAHPFGELLPLELRVSNSFEIE